MQVYLYDDSIRMYCPPVRLPIGYISLYVYPDRYYITYFIGRFLPTFLVVTIWAYAILR